MDFIIPAYDISDFQANPGNSQNQFRVMTVATIFQEALTNNKRTGSVSLVGVSGQDAMAVRRELGLRGYTVTQDVDKMVVSW